MEGEGEEVGGGGKGREGEASMPAELVSLL